MERSIKHGNLWHLRQNMHKCFDSACFCWVMQWGKVWQVFDLLQTSWSTTVESLKISPPLTTRCPTPTISFKSSTTWYFFKALSSRLTAASWSGTSTCSICSLPSCKAILKLAPGKPTRSAIPNATTFSSGKENNLNLMMNYLNLLPEPSSLQNPPIY